MKRLPYAKQSHKADIKLSYMYVLFFIFSGIVLLMIVSNILTLQSQPNDLIITDLQEGWTVTRNGTPVDVSALEEYHTGHTENDTVYQLTRTLPSDMCMAPALLVRLPRAKLSVLIDGTEIFQYNQQASSSTGIAAGTHVFVPLSEAYEGQELTLIMTAVDGSGFNGLGPVIYGSHPELQKYFLRQRRIPFIFGMFLLIFGASQLFYVPVLMHDDKPDLTLVFGALATSDCGLYLLSYYDFFDLFLNDVIANTVIEYTTLYLIPCYMCAYFLSALNGKLRKIYTAFAILDFLFVVTTFILQLTGLVFITRFLIVFNILMLIEGIPFIVISFKKRTGRQKLYIDRLQEISDRILVFALALYTVCFIVDGSLFWIFRSFAGREYPLGIPFVMFGSVVFSFLLASHYFLHSVCTLRAKVIKQSLEEKAFRDSLTGLSNRAKCQQVLENIGTEKIPYCILSMDLDRLKVVNDTLGHAEGDRLLSTFAGVLKNAFDGARLIGRMGGDEFIVICTDHMYSNVPSLIQDLQYRLDALNQENDVLKYSVSIGSATDTETELGARAFDIYMLADKRMYDAKQKKRLQRQ